MLKRASRWWIVFAACNVVVAIALVWTTVVVLRLERREQRALAENTYQESLRLSMWRMDSWLSLLLSREAARPRAAYRSLESGVHAPSALQDPDSEYIRLHFEIDAGGGVTSPQVPPGPVGGFPGISEPERIERERTLERLLPYLDLAAINAAMVRADSLVDVEAAGIAEGEAVNRVTEQAERSQNEFDARVACTVPRPPGAETAGRQIVTWLDPPGGSGEPALAFLRRMGSGLDEVVQGFAFDWPSLSGRLLLEIRDLFPEARLERASLAPRALNSSGRGLANLPVTLVTPPPDPAPLPWLTSSRTALGLAWLAAIVAVFAVGTTLHRSIDLGERRRRFVSAVTHELRTPLTTFQMYSEMLSDGVVPDDATRKQYLQTLNDEARRLSAMVGNVLDYARLEEKRPVRHLETTCLDALVSRLMSPLERRLESSTLTLAVETDSPGVEPLVVDVEAIGRILGNLVDNAAKYANGAGPSTLHLSASTADGRLVMIVRDHGPGIPPDKTRAIFAPFERGGRDPSDPVPGVGLGLALARGLARDMGGDLTLDNPGPPGASFRLELPTDAERLG